MPSISDHFRLNKSQSELDFVNVELEEDNPIFIDPFAISIRNDQLSKKCHEIIVDFFSRIIESIRANNDRIAMRLLGHLREPNETRFGLSKGKPQGAGIGPDQGEKIFIALKKSSATRTGFLSSIQECELLIPGISRDKISDLTTNIIRSYLSEYTNKQCQLFNISTSTVPLPPVFDQKTNSWISKYHNLPLYNSMPILFVPKVFSRFSPSYDHKKYYNKYVLEFLQFEHLNANTSLVQTFKNGKRYVTKQDLKAEYKCTKEFLFEFSKQNPEVLTDYKKDLEYCPNFQFLTI
ncbi:hypothetical protein [uncultured Desulfosarcina sp.]|uniref:hypothetical protein n=1 Tax=uncultured Desulfosarcina sp. TaxID=218289 RepID=UPI0029C8CD62|nr:hypothetical protein [uncultured Desulfosarcina sp.]